VIFIDLILNESKSRYAVCGAVDTLLTYLLLIKGERIVII